MDYHFLIYCWGADNNVCGMGAGSQSSWANIYLKLKFSVIFIPILASVSFRQLPLASVGFRGLPSPNISLGCRQQCMWEGGRRPKSPGRYLSKIEVFIDAYPNFSFRQLPWASAGFRGLWATISSCIVGLRKTMYLGGVRGPKFLSRYLPKIEVCSAVYPNFSFRQLPWGSAGYNRRF